MKYLLLLLFPLAAIIACAAEDEPTPMAEIEIRATIGPLCPVANVTDQTPCGFSVTKLNEIYGSYTLKILSDKGDGGTEVFSTKLMYPAKIIKSLPMGNNSIQVNDQTTAVITGIESFAINSVAKQIIELNIDTGIR